MRDRCRCGAFRISGLKRNVFDSRGANPIQDRDHLAMPRLDVTRDYHTGRRSPRMSTSQLILELVAPDRPFIEVDTTRGVDRDGKRAGLVFRIARLSGGQSHLDAFRICHAQTHEHEAREEKKHDIDQRNDFDARFFPTGSVICVHVKSSIRRPSRP